MTNSQTSLKSRLKEQPPLFWLLTLAQLSIFLWTNFTQRTFTPFPLLFHISLSITIGWVFGQRAGIINAFFLGLIRLLEIETFMRYAPDIPSAPFLLTISFVIPFIAAIISGQVGLRFQQVKQLSEDLLLERERLQQEIGRREVLEQRLQEAVTVAEEANKAKSLFLANMSHELRTPLAAIIGYNELSREQLDDSHRIATYLDKSLISAHHLQGIITDILDLSRIEAGRLVITKELFSLSECLTAVLDIMIIKTNAKNLYLRYHIHANTPDLLIGDTIHLQQVLINLLNNAVKFTNEGGITLTVMAQTDNPPHYQYQFTVTDSGVGIPEAHQQSIFETFNQVDKSRSQEQSGTGLGLPISKYLVEAMGGHISVESEVGHGTTFYFTIQAPTHEETTFVQTDGIVSYQIKL